MTDENERVRSYLLGQAEKYDVIDLWPRVVAQRSAFLQALEDVSEEQARWRPGGGEGEDAWGILEVSHHLLAWTRNVVDIIEATARSETVEKLPPGYLDAGDGATFAEVRRALIAESARFASLPTRLPEEPDLTTTIDHPRFGPLNCRAWFLFLRLHDGDHTRQVEALKETEGYPA